MDFVKISKSKSKQQGFTLIEVLVSLTILGIVSVSILTFFNQAYDYTKRNESKTVGVNVARNVLFYIEQQNFDSMNQKYLNELTEQQLTINNCSDKMPNEDTNVFEPKVCEGFFSTKINNIQFETIVTLMKHPEEELQNYVIPVTVEVQWGENQRTTVEGVIQK